MFDTSGQMIRQIIETISPKLALAKQRPRTLKPVEATVITASPYKDSVLTKKDVDNAIQQQKDKGKAPKAQSSNGKTRKMSLKDQDICDDEKRPYLIC